MKRLYTLLFCFTSTIAFSQLDTVVINVDVLGLSYPLTTYHHPIEGFYLIKKNTEFELTKKQQKVLQSFEFINPTSKHLNIKNYIQANSLRHYIDPNELIYINWRVGRDTTNFIKLEQFITDSKTLRQTKYQPLVQSYFKPFYIKKTEVTNWEYHQFTTWVKDSIFIEKIYDNYSDFTKAKQLLNIPKGIIIKDTIHRQKLRKLYHLNFDCDYRNVKQFNQVEIIELILPYKKNSNERWYKERPVNVDTLKYLYNDKVIPIYPDTITWEYQNPLLFNNPKINMYFWHPAYDNYPVVGVSKQQAEAYCYWKTQQLNNSWSTLDLPFTVTASLPNTMNYENTIRHNFSSIYEKDIEDNELITNLKLQQDLTLKTKVNDNRLSKQYNFLTTSAVDIPQAEPKTKKDLKEIKLLSDSHYDIGLHKIMYQRITENYLENNICFLSNNVSEWMTESYEDHYKNLLKAYINYNCFTSIDYCEGQKIVDERLIRQNDIAGYLIYGSNWYDERYGSFNGVNKAGLYPKTFKDSTKQFSTVGFRYVLIIEEK